MTANARAATLTRPDHPYWGWLLGAGGFIVGMYLLPTSSARWLDVLYLTCSWGAVLAVLAGVRWRRPHRPWAWWWIAVGLASWAIGDIIYIRLQLAGRDPLPSLADVFYLFGFVPLLIGLGKLISTRGQGLRSSAMIDSAIVAVAAGVLIWTALIGPILHGQAGSPLARAIAIAYPILDVLLLAFAVRLATAPGGSNTAIRLITAAAALPPVADTLYVPLDPNGAVHTVPALVADMLLMASYVLWGAAALHPSMAGLSDVDHRQPEPFTRRRLVALTAAALVGPFALAIQLWKGVPLDVGAVVFGSSLLFALVVVRMYVAIQEIRSSTAQRDLLAQDLAHQSSHDALTQLTNRGQALELIDAALRRAERTGGVVGVLVVDLDHFNTVNRSFGHRIGDEVLRRTATRLSEAVRPGDAVGRLGGDEFVVLAEGVESETELVGLAERLGAIVAVPAHLAGQEVTVTASVGIALSTDAAEASTLLRDADVAAARAKAAGGGRSEVFDDALRAELEARARLEAELRAALADGQLVLHYQAVVAVVTRRLLGYEALVRWEVPGQGLVLPAAFIPTAERSGLVCDLDRWVIREAARQLAAWRAADPRTFEPLTLAVNVSGRHLAEATIVDDVAAALLEAKLPPDRLIVEITETVLVDEPTVLAELQGLRALGVRISIDDFGTGYTSIGQLQHLHADTLKIDRSLVASPSPGVQELVRLVVHAAHAFGLTVVAEGVEQEAQLDALRTSGCDSAQGFLFGRPQPANVIRPTGGGSAPTTNGCRC